MNSVEEPGLKPDLILSATGIQLLSFQEITKAVDLRHADGGPRSQVLVAAVAAEMNSALVVHGAVRL